ncbi:histidine phosphatase family protein [Inmirania thermothiophila]|uniref:Alpha-ribazole phosphatase/probable phosphoglycerate mutase n=1 Tax=Inmirania thermothiophila TaxID=1750597 RepID=A0A3N1XZM1_9GAMM|nr:histidine phosphatase family protein [Inmirania thermothiophila]ROR32054.1 alpha-ribazole phosphatase/probable phosphoglycerate mutase [Inmirania thermothiophila]
MEVDLLRHGACEGGPILRGGGRDDPLSPEVWRQMEAALRGAGPWRRILTSPLRRCSEFAWRLARRTGTRLETVAELAEMGFGRWEGRTTRELADEPGYLQRLVDPAAATPPEGESWEAFRARVCAGWEAVLAGTGPVLVVTHGGVIRLILGLVLGMPDEALLRIEVPPACRTRLRCGVDEAGRRWASLIAHVPPELGG